ncbi:MAG: hypothetical protein ACREVO_15310 [Steroidobacteraceae bacterium]
MMWAVVSGKHSAYDVLINLLAEGESDLLGDALISEGSVLPVRMRKAA